MMVATGSSGKHPASRRSWRREESDRALLCDARRRDGATRDGATRDGATCRTRRGTLQGECGLRTLGDS